MEKVKKIVAFSVISIALVIVVLLSYVKYRVA